MILKALHHRCLTRFWVWLQFWMCQNSEYASRFEYVRILNIPEFWIYQDNTGFKICLIVPGYVWICLNMRERICVNMPKSPWMAFVLHFAIFPFVLQFFFYLNTWRLQETRGYSLKEHEAVFLKRQNLYFFSIATGSISFVFHFKLNIFTSKV